jgi:hypothetical protein
MMVALTTELAHRAIRAAEVVEPTAPAMVVQVRLAGGDGGKDDRGGTDRDGRDRGSR